ncbi:hypothetical protein [Brasilonema sennae]|uniref:hypothetical protein n=1 Tax=Brasilonema sennae TaxID=1397703 RepID=UPI00155A4925|nr:hypothetical protein [Brasilonema sennae]
MPKPTLLEPELHRGAENECTAVNPNLGVTILLYITDTLWINKAIYHAIKNTLYGCMNKSSHYL